MPVLCLQAFSDVFPHLVAASDVPTLVKIADVDFDNIDAVFCCLPHATTQQIIKSLPRHVKIVDLSADFRLADVNTYAEWWVCQAMGVQGGGCARCHSAAAATCTDVSSSTLGCWMGQDLHHNTSQPPCSCDARLQHVMTRCRTPAFNCGRTL
jgi:hypothetical protein